MILDVVSTSMTRSTPVTTTAVETTSYRATASGPYPDYSHIELSYILPYNPQVHTQEDVIRLLERYKNYSQHILDTLLFIIVDEGQAQSLHLPDDYNLNLLHFRILEPIIWNDAGAKNIGVVQAKSEKILLADFNHYFLEDTLERLLTKKLPRYTLYRFMREDTHTQKKSSNIIYISRSSYLALYGFDEEFSGHCGYGEIFFLRWAAAHGMILTDYPSNFPAIHTPNPRADALTEEERDLHRNGLLYKRKLIDLRHYGARGGHSRRNCSFSWKTLSHQLRTNQHGYKKSDSLWIKTQWLRHLANLFTR